MFFLYVFNDNDVFIIFIIINTDETDMKLYHGAIHSKMAPNISILVSYTNFASLRHTIGMSGQKLSVCKTEIKGKLS